MSHTPIYAHPDGHEITVGHGLITACTAEGIALSMPIGPDGLAALGAALLERATFDQRALATAALKFAQAAREVTRSQNELTDAYYAWREAAGVTELIERDDENWSAMMAATAEEYRLLQNAKGRERRAKAKLLALADELGAMQ